MTFGNKELKKFAKKMGADLVGIASAKRMKDAPAGHRPTDFLPNAKSVIAVAVRISHSAVDGLPKTRREYVSDGEGARARINKVVYELSRKLEEGGFAAISFFWGRDKKKIMGDLSLKHAAVAAGLGEFGLNNLVLTPQYGAKVILGAVVTNAEIEPDPPLKDELCDLCEACLKLCPTGAIRNPQGYDRMRGWPIPKETCRHYVEDVIEPEYGRHGCGMCIKACHVGKAKK